MRESRVPVDSGVRRRPKYHTTPTGGGFWGLLGGATAAFLFAGVTGVLLLINGSITLVVFRALADADPEWHERKGVTQFGLFAVPLVLVVTQWLILDVAVKLFHREPPEDDRWNSI